MIQDYHQYKDSDHHDKWQPVVQEVNCCGNTFRLCDTLCIQRSVIACSVENPAKYSCSKSETDLLCCRNTGISKTNGINSCFLCSVCNGICNHSKCHTAGHTNTAAFQYVADDHHDRTGTAKNSESEESKSHNYHSCFINSCFEAVFLNSLPKYGTLHDFFSRALYSPGSQFYLYFKSGKDPQLVNLFKKILKEYQTQKRYTSSMINALLEIFFICLLRNHEKNIIVPNPAGKKQEKNIIFILKYIELHYATLTLPKLSAFFNYSERQLTRILKNYTGKTFSTLIQDIRLSRAVELLKQPTLPVTTVMEEIGYSNITHFYKIFEKRFHMTPAEYRSSISPDSSLL